MLMASMKILTHYVQEFVAQGPSLGIPIFYTKIDNFLIYIFRLEFFKTLNKNKKYN
jgi:hypothetical protein